MKAIVDEDLCIGCGLCAEICPEVFEMSDDMIAKVIVDIISEELQESAKDATESCPVDAIRLED